MYTVSVLSMGLHNFTTNFEIPSAPPPSVSFFMIAPLHSCLFVVGAAGPAISAISRIAIFFQRLHNVFVHIHLVVL